MPTILTHSIIPICLGLGLGRKRIPLPMVAIAAVSSVIPDLDVLAFKLKIPYESQFGHRGFAHSVVFALGLSIIVSLLLRRRRMSFHTSCAFVFVSVASHGLLDALTNGGKGIALLWPFTPHRFFAPIQMIEASPIGVRCFFTASGAAAIGSELLWVWLPFAIVAVALAVLRNQRRPNHSLNTAGSASSDPAAGGRAG